MIEFDLPERLSVAGDNALIPFLRQNAETGVRISAGRLRRLDTLLVQTLIAAAADRRRRGLGFVLSGLSGAQADQLAALGVTQAILPMELAE